MNTVLITGTTSGIGKAFAEKFAANGDRIILVSRNEKKLISQQLKLKEQYQADVKYIVCDLTQKEAAQTIFRQLKDWNLKINILLNNAGFNECGLFTQTNMQKEADMMNLHIQFPTELSKYLLPDMISNGYGRILNVGSTGSFIASPSDAVYSATKAYILSFSNALNGELSRTGVKITALCPGATNTEFAKKAGIDKSLLFKIAVMEPKKVVDIAFPKLLAGKRIIIPGLYNKILVLSSKLIPVTLLNKITLIMTKNNV